MKPELFNTRIASLRPSASIRFMAKAEALRASGVDVINLAGGEPDFATPAPIIEEACRQMKAGFTHYTSGPGIPELRSRIVRKLAGENGAVYSDGEILVTPGGKNAVYLAVTAVLNPGDEALYLDPAWVSYVPIIQAAGGVPVPVVLPYDDGYRLSLDALEAKTTPRTKLLIINFPCNPTGKLLSPADAEVITRYMLAHPDILLLSDEVYERITFDGLRNVSPASIQAIRDRVLTVNGFSKSVAMTGWRLGYLAAPRPVVEQAYKLYQHSLTCVSGFIQKAAVVALDCTAEMEQMRLSYQRRRDRFISGLNAIDGIDARLPEGAFYAWLRIDGMSSAESCDYLLEQARVAGVPGDSYGEGGVNCLRFSFATAEEQLEEAVCRIKAAMDRR